MSHELVVGKSDEELYEEMDAERAVEDTTTLIRYILASPLESGRPVRTPDPMLSLSELAKSNTTVQTRIILSIVRNAMIGDLKASEFLMKYGGLDPTRNGEVENTAPIIIDDIPLPAPVACPISVEEIP